MFSTPGACRPHGGQKPFQSKQNRLSESAAWSRALRDSRVVHAGTMRPCLACVPRGTACKQRYLRFPFSENSSQDIARRPTYFVGDTQCMNVQDDR
jgi:hypothetical protein